MRVEEEDLIEEEIRIEKLMLKKEARRRARIERKKAKMLEAKNKAKSVLSATPLADFEKEINRQNQVRELIHDKNHPDFNMFAYVPVNVGFGTIRRPSILPPEVEESRRGSVLSDSNQRRGSVSGSPSRRASIIGSNSRRGSATGSPSRRGSSAAVQRRGSGGKEGSPRQRSRRASADPSLAAHFVTESEPQSFTEALETVGLGNKSIEELIAIVDKGAESMRLFASHAEFGKLLNHYCWADAIPIKSLNGLYLNENLISAPLLPSGNRLVEVLEELYDPSGKEMTTNPEVDNRIDRNNEAGALLDLLDYGGAVIQHALKTKKQKESVEKDKELILQATRKEEMRLQAQKEGMAGAGTITGASIPDLTPEPTPRPTAPSRWGGIKNGVSSSQVDALSPAALKALALEALNGITAEASQPPRVSKRATQLDVAKVIIDSGVPANRLTAGSIILAKQAAVQGGGGGGVSMGTSRMTSGVSSFSHSHKDSAKANALGSTTHNKDPQSKPPSRQVNTASFQSPAQLLHARNLSAPEVEPGDLSPHMDRILQSPLRSSALQQLSLNLAAGVNPKAALEALVGGDVMGKIHNLSGRNYTATWTKRGRKQISMEVDDDEIVLESRDKLKEMMPAYKMKQMQRGELLLHADEDDEGAGPLSAANALGLSRQESSESTLTDSSLGNDAAKEALIAERTKRKRQTEEATQIMSKLAAQGFSQSTLGAIQAFTQGAEQAAEQAGTSKKNETETIKNAAMAALAKLTARKTLSKQALPLYELRSLFKALGTFLRDPTDPEANAEAALIEQEVALDTARSLTGMNSVTSTLQKSPSKNGSEVPPPTAPSALKRRGSLATLHSAVQNRMFPGVHPQNLTYAQELQLKRKQLFRGQMSTANQSLHTLSRWQSTSTLKGMFPPASPAPPAAPTIKYTGIPDDQNSVALMSPSASALTGGGRRPPSPTTRHLNPLQRTNASMPSLHPNNISADQSPRPRFSTLVPPGSAGSSSSFNSAEVKGPVSRGVRMIEPQPSAVRFLPPVAHQTSNNSPSAAAAASRDGKGTGWTNINRGQQFTAGVLKAADGQERHKGELSHLNKRGKYAPQSVDPTKLLRIGDFEEDDPDLKQVRQKKILARRSTMTAVDTEPLQMASTLDTLSTAHMATAGSIGAMGRAGDVMVPPTLSISPSGGQGGITSPRTMKDMEQLDKLALSPSQRRMMPQQMKREASTTNDVLNATFHSLYGIDIAAAVLGGEIAPNDAATSRRRRNISEADKVG